MKITVSNELTNIKRFLKSNGYYVYEERDNVPSDIYICNELISGMMNLNNNNPDGVFIVYAKNKTNDQILYEIKNRLYSPLF